VILANSVDRWYEAARRADEQVDLWSVPFRSGRRGAAVRNVILFVAVGALAYGMSFLPTDTDELWAYLVQVALRSVDLPFSLLIIVCIFIGVLMVNRSQSRPWHLITGALTRDERKDIRLQISGENLVNEKELHLIVVMAKQRRTVIGSLVPLYAAAVLASLRWAVVSNSDTALYFSVAVTGVLAVVGGWMLLTYLRANSFVADHADVEYRPTQAYLDQKKEGYPDDYFEDEYLDD
jgi:hypothetical protein